MAKPSSVHMVSASRSDSGSTLRTPRLQDIFDIQQAGSKNHSVSESRRIKLGTVLA